MKTFRDAVEAARAAHGWTLPEVAARLDVSLEAVRSWLKPAAASRRDAPSWAVLALTALVTGKPTKERRGGVEITYRARGRK